MLEIVAKPCLARNSDELPFGAAAQLDDALDRDVQAHAERPARDGLVARPIVPAVVVQQKGVVLDGFARAQQSGEHDGEGNAHRPIDAKELWREDAAHRVDAGPKTRNSSDMRTILLALGLALLVGPASAQQRPTLRFDPNRIEFATPWAQSSPCLGDRSDPMCTAHAILVCATFSRRPECGDFPRQHKFSNPQGWTRVEYRIVAAGIVSHEAVRRFDQSNDRERFEPLSGLAYIAPGVLQVRIMDRTCGPDAADCSTAPWRDLMIVAERRRGTWSYVEYMSFRGGVWLVE
jgi:hypothetical protein